MTIASTSARAAHERWRSPAKVNLCLRIVGRRVDGYHLLDSIFLPIEFYDDVAVTVHALRQGAPTVVDVRADDDATPTDGTNLAARAVHLLFEACGIGGTVAVELRKRIPPGSGLGGGSGNAATILRGMNELLALGLRDDALGELALRLGADVPFFLGRTPARVRGVGEEIEPLPHWPAMSLVVVVPPVRISTPWAFERYRQAVPVGEASEPSEAARLAGGAPPSADLLVNDLERVVLPAFPEIGEAKARLREAGATAAVMSGSGAAVVGLAPSTTAATAIAATVRSGMPGALVRVTAVRRVG